MTDPMHPKTAAEAAEAWMRNVPAEDPKMPEPKPPKPVAHADEPKRAGFLQQIDACRQSVAQWPDWMRATRLAPEWMRRMR